MTEFLGGFGVVKRKKRTEAKESQSPADIGKLMKRTGYQFQDDELFFRALTHSSYANEMGWDKSCNNERLEFLGDAVLELVSSEYLYAKEPALPEGEMTRSRASMVCEPTLALCARELALGECLFLGHGENVTGGRDRDSILSDALEALIGAIYLDGGFTNAKDFIYRAILADIDQKKLFYDSKTILQEMVQGFSKESLKYELLSEEGPDHDKRFTFAVCIGSRSLAEGTGKTKKAAEQSAAYKAILKIKESGGEIHVSQEY